jgi:hypothetical protein
VVGVIYTIKEPDLWFWSGYTLYDIFRVSRRTFIVARVPYMLELDEPKYYIVESISELAEFFVDAICSPERWGGDEKLLSRILKVAAKKHGISIRGLSLDEAVEKVCEEVPEE